MRLLSIPVSWLLAATTLLYVTATTLLVTSNASLGSWRFFGCAALAALAYTIMLARVWRSAAPSRRLLLLALAAVILVRVPPAVADVGYDSDMVRYLWDGRIQRLGYNPYLVVPADPALAHTHTEASARMPSRRDRTPYPPAAQLFFRLVASIWDSTYGMKVALLACDLLTLLVVWRWLVVTNRNGWLALAYGWNPVVVFEVAHSGHVDALGALWIATTAYLLTRGRTALAGAAYTLAIATKPLPIVLVPLLVGRLRVRDAVLSAALFAVLAFPFVYLSLDPFRGIATVVGYIRFNGPLFPGLAELVSPTGAAIVAILAGTAVAAWARLRLRLADPAAWAWPMATALAFGPVVYPWYLLYLAPFLLSVATLPLTMWTFSVMSVYVVWQGMQDGGRWRVSADVMAFEYSLVVAAGLAVLWWIRIRWRNAPPPRPLTEAAPEPSAAGRSPTGLTPPDV